MDLDSYLRSHRLDSERLAAFIREKFNPVDGEVIYVTGSLLEGLGNRQSDLDVYLLTDREMGDRLINDSLAVFSLDGATVDIEVVSRCKVDEMLARLASLPSDEPRDHRISATAFTPTELKFLHNLRIGLPLGNEVDFQEVVSKVDARRLSRVLFDHALAWMDSLHVDIIGLLEVRDYSSARFLLQHFLSYLAAALLAATGNTNPAEKWRIRKLMDLQLSTNGFCLPGGLEMADAVAALDGLYLRCESDRRSVHDQLGRLLQLAYIIVPWGQRRFFANESLLPVVEIKTNRLMMPDVSELDERNLAHTVLGKLELSCRIRYGDGKYVLSVIGEGGTIALNEFAYELLLYFDGVTFESQVIHILSTLTSAPPVDLADAIRDFQLVLESRGLIQSLENEVVS
ncbi:hypothetical protein HA052_17360 [Chromobacterium haemolyticum]|uniref:Polymerase nucleotidyl transferase domain-containing protein n=1 Tax=Chromobacterium fluminis TaxID=3044269 RepID=A0ABX0LBS4_9NEIS|nr:hypothetical protein [Chromobacterium haemolyticum]NHR06959.1 hypothetical protein [Chromobacterium haemolyticum]